MTSSPALSQSQGGTLRSILVGSPQWKSHRPPSCSAEISSSSRPPITPLTRLRSEYAWCRGLSSALCSCGFLVALLLLVAVVLFPRAGPPRHTIPCWAEQCGAYVRALEASINTSRDPCDDFHRYVCDKWRPASGGRTFLEDSMLTFRKVVMRNAANASPPPKNQDGYEKAAMLYQSCVTEPTPDTLGDFRLFLKERRLPWPEIDNDANALDVALDLSLNWHLPVFFYVYFVFIAPEPTSRGPQKFAISSSSRLVFTDNSLGFGPETLLEERRLRESNAVHICALREAMTDRGVRNSDMVHCQALDRLQQDILEKLAGGKADVRQQYWMHYDSLKSFAKHLNLSVSGEQWARLVRKHLNEPEAKFISSIPVEVRNRRQMVAMGRILINVENKNLLDFMGLSVVQYLGRFESAKLATLIYGGHSNLAERHPDVCYRLVNRLAPRLLTTPSVKLLLDAERIRKVSEIFTSVKQFLGKSLRTASWIPNSSRPLVLRLLNETAMTHEAALTGELGGIDGPSGLAESLPDFGGQFLDNLSRIPHNSWDKVLRFLEPPSSSASTPDKTAWALHISGDLHWADLWRQHDTSLVPQMVVLPSLYMLDPVFPAGAYESVNYGVVGSLLARQLLAAMDPTGPAVDLSLSGHPKESSDDKKDGILRCIREAFVQDRSNVTIAQVVTSGRDVDSGYLYAMFVAAASLKPLYEALASSPGYPDWSSGFKGYTADQLFFLAICFASCGARLEETASQGEPSQADWCNMPLRLSTKFADAFGCAARKNMTYSEGCDL
ncbi:neprilysin-1-like [Amblyomma americanum]